MLNHIVVTAVYDIQRERIDGRDIEYYKQWFLRTCSSIKNYMVIYLDKRLNWIDDILKIRNANETHIIQTHLDEIPMWKYKNQVTQILQNKQFYQKHPNDITNLLPEYVLIQYSKFGWIKCASKIFDAHNFIWLDAGFSRFYNYERKYLLRNQIYNGVLVQSSCQEKIKFINYDNYIGTNECIIKGGMWIVHRDDIQNLEENIINIWEREMLNKNRLDNEQIAMALLCKNYPRLFTICQFNDENTNFFLSVFETTNS